TSRTNRLADESSPYLLLHRHNPVDWYPWGEEALERARREDKPVFLSVGYSTCYWCHVMERESFSNPEIASLMNRELVNVKVDREERPDLDEVYMAATQLMTEHGGWPNSVFLTPDLKPFFAGTYFPPEDRYGRPGFPALIGAIAEAWRSRRPELEEQAEEMARALRRFLEERSTPASAPPPARVAEASLAALERRFDAAWGGFGRAPKFPTPSNLFLLLEFAAERPRAAEMLAATLDQMGRGGIFDQLAGGFHRYATDREWKVPHFEKMLYDNGLLLEIYAREHARSGDPEAARVARDVAWFLEREMSGPDGEFWSAIDAETHGHEGAHHVWTRAELLEVLGEEDAAFLAPIYGFDGPPFFEADRYVLHLPRPLAEQAAARRVSPEELLAQIAPLRDRLLAARGRRERPATDDKVLADWNGMAISGFAVAGRLLGDGGLIERAARAAEFVLARLRPAGRLYHAWRGGEAKIAAFLADYAYLIRGLLELDAASGPAGGERWRAAAAELAAEQQERLGDPRGGWWNAASSPDLLFRSQEVFDGAVPAANAIAVLNALTLAERTGEPRFRAEAERALRAFAPLVEAQVEAARTLTVAARRFDPEPVAAAGAAADAEPGGVASGGDRADPLRAAFGDLGVRAEAERVVAAEARYAGGGRGPGDWRPFRVQLHIAPGFHLHPNPASDSAFVATAIEGDGMDLRRVVYPPGVTTDAGAAGVYRGEVEISGEASPLLPTGRLLLTYQACDETRCLPAVTRELPVR
ncbi:MAG TPA: thioredoxin domain-containing protein, partial [Thermoanaerobaculia bacterium]|nr:thioredoxin domain-containing protein [Thermoanaerobaculia bacterium]